MGALIARDGLEFKKSEHGMDVCRRPPCLFSSPCHHRRRREDPSQYCPEGRTVQEKGLEKNKPPCPGTDDWYEYRGEMSRRPEGMCRTGMVLVNCAADGNLRLVPRL